MKKLFAVLFLLGASTIHAQDTKPFEIFGTYGTQTGWIFTNLSAGLGYRISTTPFDELTFRYGYTANGFDQYRLGTKKRILNFPHLGVEWTTDYGVSILRAGGVVKPAVSSGTYLVVPMSIISFSIGIIVEKTFSITTLPECRFGFSYDIGKSRK